MGQGWRAQPPSLVGLGRDQGLDLALCDQQCISIAQVIPAEKSGCPALGVAAGKRAVALTGVRSRAQIDHLTIGEVGEDQTATEIWVGAPALALAHEHPGGLSVRKQIGVLAAEIVGQSHRVAAGHAENRSPDGVLVDPACVQVGQRVGVGEVEQVGVRPKSDRRIDRAIVRGIGGDRVGDTMAL